MILNDSHWALQFHSFIKRIFISLKSHQEDNEWITWISAAILWIFSTIILKAIMKILYELRLLRYGWWKKYIYCKPFKWNTWRERKLHFFVCVVSTTKNIKLNFYLMHIDKKNNIFYVAAWLWISNIIMYLEMSFLIIEFQFWKTTHTKNATRISL